VTGGAQFIDNFEIDDTNFVLTAKGDDIVAAALYTAASVLLSARDVLVVNQDEKVAFAVPRGAATDGFAAGPIPVRKQFGSVNFFWYGSGIKSGTLRIYDASGKSLRKIKVDNNISGNSGKRVLGQWDLKDAKGRVVPEGTYLVKGAFEAISGKSEKVSKILRVL